MSGRRTELCFAALGVGLFALFGESAVAPPPAREPAREPHELLFREALARGYHESDPLVRRRLARNLRFAVGDEGRSEQALVEEALALGMHESDLVVRRRLVQKMQLRAASRVRRAEPERAALEAHLRRHAARYREPARTRISHAYARTRERARSLAARAAARPGDADALRSAGDAWPLGYDLPPLDAAALAGRFGPALAARVTALEPGSWSGPLASAHGFHLVFVHGHAPAREPALERVRAQVRESWLGERAGAALAEEVAALRRRAAAGSGAAP